ncbi:hypothetical protein AVEN_261303-1 [Araneus ventricosus]|uniref:Follistatin-like domain-containing protein n=1 Tax=Araneus ventricosus TaxID=182803 RepID=A0A4Y2Q9Z8_ARAVE|nr:hypothetical protein AVEN_261303-1 [Araneus ventricosus]
MTSRLFYAQGQSWLIWRLSALLAFFCGKPKAFLIHSSRGTGFWQEQERERWHHGECRLRSSFIFKTRNTPQFLSNMKFLKLFIFLLIVTAVASKKAHRKKEKKHLLKDTSPEKDILDFLQDDEKDEEEHKKKKHTLENELLLENFDTDKGGYNEDPCLKHKCGPGKQCEIDDNGKAQCVCVPKCAEEDDSRRKVRVSLNQ